MADSIAHYRIGPKLGQGAMGEVYRATDTKLGRDVAVKLIAPHLTQDAARMASFTREAQVLASLNHPNIAAIYGVEQDAIVMELVEGPTLAERIRQGPLPLDEALGIARQVAEALAAAHDKGIVHRDLKPANIKITPEGTVKLLDFGLAKAAAVAAVNPADAMTIAMTMSGSTISGTPGYMAPEQARGQDVDKRADIWAFGVVLYEMLTGTMLFRGETTTDVLAAVVREDADLGRVPPRVRPLLRRCLEKDPKRRLRDIADAMLFLEAASEPAAAAAEAPRGVARTWLPWGVAAALLVALAVVLVAQLRDTAPGLPLVRFRFSLPEGVTFTQTAPFAVSPDGRRLAFPAVGDDGVPRVWIHDFSEAAPRPLAEVQPNPLTLAWSPDSRQILYAHQDQLKRVDIGGSPPDVIVQRLGGPGPGALIGAAWFDDGTIVFGTSGGVMKVPASGGTPQALTKANAAAGEVHMVFSPLPGGRFLYARSGVAGGRAVYVGSRDAAPEQQDQTPLLRTDMGALFAPSSPSADDGQLLFMRDTTLVAQPFDASQRRLSGEPVPIAAGVYSLVSPVLGMPFVSVSKERTIVYRTGAISDLARQLTWYSRDGAPLGAVGDRARYGQLKISPDGSHLAASQTEIRTGSNSDIWLIDLATQTPTRLTFGSGADAQPTWSPDGRFIAWVSIQDGIAGIYRKPANGAGGDDLLYQFPKGTSGGIILSDWSTDGFLVFAQGGDIFALPIGPDSNSTREPIPVVQTMAREFGPDLSPDGRWLVYISDETGRQELFAQPFALRSRAGAAPVVGKWMVSSNGTLGLARWRGDSRELFFTAGDGSLMAVDVTADARAFQAGAPRRLFQLPRPFVVQTPNPGTLADIQSDGQRLLLALPSEESTRGELSVIMNWRPG